MRAQVSLEFLLTAAAFLAVLGLITPVIVSTYLRTREQIDVIRARAALERIVATADELCALGGRSKRVVDVTFARETEIVASGNRVTVLNISRNTVCKLYPFSATVTTRQLTITNEEGKIRIS